MFKSIPKYCNVWYEEISRISQWSDTGPSWPSCFVFSNSLYNCLAVHFCGNAGTWHGNRGRDINLVLSTSRVYELWYGTKKRLCSSLLGVSRGSVVKCLTRNPGVLGTSRTRSSGFFVGVSLGKTLQSPSLVLVKPRKDMNDVSCRRDITKILLKAA